MPDAMATASAPDRSPTVLGKPPSHWVYRPSATAPLDLTRPAPPSFPAPAPGSSIQLRTSSDTISIAPALTGLVVVDMQNFFLSPALGRDPAGAGHAAVRTLLDSTIPACRAAGIRVVWLNWGVTDAQIADMPPALLRGFGALRGLSGGGAPPLQARDRPAAAYRGFGSPLGELTLPDGTSVDGGRLLVRGSWNAQLFPALAAAARPDDIWVSKDRLSGLWDGGRTECGDALRRAGLRTLLFAGVNTDQCVGGTLQDAHALGWDCVMVRDACGTSSPDAARDGIEYNVGRSWGFLVESEEVRRGVERMNACKA